MEQSKSPKSCAYARLGKQISGKHSVPEEHLKKTRNSTGNIYEQILNQFDPQQGKYIRNLVHKNQKIQNQSTSTAAIHNRKKSYADVEPPLFKDKQKQKPQIKREERQTLIKSKGKQQNMLLNQVTPKHNAGMYRSDFIGRNNQLYQSANLSGFIKKEEKKQDKGFLDNLNSYLESLNQTVDHISHVGHVGRSSVPAEKFTQTLKFSVNQDSYTLASKLEQAITKTKQYKLKNHYLERELAKYGKRQRKMKECLYEMLEELKHTNNELTKEKKERKRLEKVIDSFELQNSKPERKTIGKHYNLSKIQEFQQQINMFTEPQVSDLDSSIRDIFKPSFQPRKNRYHDRQFSHVNRGILDSHKIDQLFKSGFQSEGEDSYEQ